MQHPAVFVGCRRPGDLTLGDFWGAGNFRKRYDDDKGTSLVLLNSPKAKINLSDFAGKFSLAEQVPSDSAVPFNPSLVHASKPDARRAAFFDDFEAGKSWEELAASYITTEKPPRRKTGILNLQHTNNFGACLVAYALQTAIERCGSKAQVINYRPEKKARPVSGAFRRERAAGRNFEKFRRRFLNLTRVCRNMDDLSELNASLDSFVVESDRFGVFVMFTAFCKNICWLLRRRPKRCFPMRPVSGRIFGKAMIRRRKLCGRNCCGLTGFPSGKKAALPFAGRRSVRKLCGFWIRRCCCQRRIMPRLSKNRS